MAYYPRKYFPDLPPLSRPSDYPPPRPDYQSYEPYYPRRRQAYQPYEPDYPRPLESDIGPVEEYNTTDYVVNKRYKYYGLVLCFLSVASLAFEIANVVFTILTFKDTITPSPLAVPYILTWIAAGIWGSIPVFITGVLAIKVAGTYKVQVRVFALFCSMSAVVFAPAMIGLSIAEIIMYPKSNLKFEGKTCYSFDDTGTLSCPKFFLPLAVAILGGIEFYLTLMVTIIFCFCNRPGKEKTKVSGLPAEYQPADYPPDAPYSSYPELIRRRQAPYYRSMPPSGQPQELPSRGDVAPDLSFLRSYHDSRPFMSRGFGMASAYNHGLTYGNLPGATPVSPFYGSIPSLAAFGAPGPNPAYRIVYN